MKLPVGKIQSQGSTLTFVLFCHCSQGIALTPTSSGQLQFPLINMSTLKAHLDKSVKLEPMSPQMKGGTTTVTVSSPQQVGATTTVTLPAGVNLL